MRILRQLSIVLAFLLAVTGMAAAQEYRLGSQDKITVNVYGEDDLSGEFELDGEGKVALPLLGDIHVGNMTLRSEEHTSELQSLMRISYAVFFLKKKKDTKQYTNKT